MPTMTRPIDSDYRRVISAKFATKRNGDPVTCRYCSTPVMIGRDFAAVDAIGTWHNICSVCADSRVAQVTGLVNRLEALAGTLEGAPLEALMATAAPLDALCTAAIQGDEVAARSVTVPLFALLEAARTAVTQVSAQSDPFAEQVQALKGVLQYLNGRDITFATSLVSQWEARGSLSDKQKPYVASLLEKGQAVEADTVLTPVTTAILARADAMADDDTQRASLRFAIPSGGHNSLDFLAVYKGRMERHVGAPGDVRKIPLAPAQALTLANRIMASSDDDFLAAQMLYGQAIHACGRCGSPLTDDGSKAMGLGPDCQRKLGF